MILQFYTFCTIIFWGGCPILNERFGGSLHITPVGPDLTKPVKTSDGVTSPESCRCGAGDARPQRVWSGRWSRWSRPRRD